MDDGELMRKVRAGDRAAFEELYRRRAQRTFALRAASRSFASSLPAGAVATFRGTAPE